jgi:LysM repeat protein
MTTSEQHRRMARLRGSAIPIVLAGSMVAGLGMTGPIEPVVAKKSEKPKSTPATLAKSIRTVFMSASTAVAPTTAPAATTVADAPMTYTVVAGDTVSSIAGHYGLATASVLALNGLGWKSVIFPGQKLKLTNSGVIPIASTSNTGPAVTKYTIKSGDTVGAIASRFGVATQTLLSANGLGWSSIIYPGQTITIPGASVIADAAPAVAITSTVPSTVPVVAQSTSYTIVSGDTISSIAAKFGVTAQALVSANGMSLSSIIYAGHRLSIPGASGIQLASSTTSILTPEMTGNARTIIQVGRSLGVPDYGIVIALATALQESGLRNLPYGDRDSLGLFQQRPSAGWGSPSQLLTPSYAARLFFGGASNPNAGKTKGLLDIAGWQSKTVAQAAQAVQRSAYPDAYAKWEATARKALADLA